MWAGLTVTLHVARTSGDESCPRTRFEMLALFSRELEGTGIAWFVHYGTLLGAVRDQAIIPWTNDIDVCVPLRAFIREDDLMKHFTCFEMSDYTQAVMRLYSKGAHVERFSSHWFWFSSPVYIDVYHLFPCAHKASPVNCTGATSPHEGVYLVGSCHDKINRNMRKKDIFPINWTGSTINGMHFPTPHNPEAILLHEYGPAWCLPPLHRTGSLDEGCKKNTSLAPLSQGLCEGFAAAQSLRSDKLHLPSVEARESLGEQQVRGAEG